MSLLRRSSGAAELIPGRVSRQRAGKPAVTSRGAMQQSVIWAAANMHAAIESLMPVDAFRMVGDLKVEMKSPPLFTSPSSFAEGHPESMAEWLYARRMSLQLWGNCFGEITHRDALGLPAQIQLVPAEDVVCKVKNYQVVEYRFGRTVMDPRDVYHTRGALLPGVPVGLSPIAYAMLAIETSLSARGFAADWFGNSAFPGGHMKNDSQVLKRGQADSIKAQFKESQEAGDLLVTGKDWTFSPIQAKAVEAGFLEAMSATDVELCRFMNVPANVIDVPLNGSATIQYQNITAKNLDFLVGRMGPSLKHTDDDLTSFLPLPRFVKLNRAAFLAMDPQATADLMKVQIDSRLRAPSELRKLEDKPPFTEEQLAEFDRLFGSKNPNPTPKGLPA